MQASSRLRFRSKANSLLSSTALIPVAGVLAMAPAQAHAETVTWDGQTSTNTATATNWSTDILPSAASTVIIDNGALPNQPTVSTAQTFGVTEVSAGTLTVASTLTSPTINISGTGVLNFVSGNIFGAINVADGGTLLVEDRLGTGASITLNGVGRNGQGALRGTGLFSSVEGPILLESDSRIESVFGTQLRGIISGDGRTLTFGGSGGVSIQSGSIRTGSGSVIKEGTGTLGLFGVNTYTGDTIIRSGSLQTQGGSALSDTGRLFLETGTNTQIAEGVETIGSLEGGGRIFLQRVSVSSGGLLVGDSTSTTFSGQIVQFGGEGTITKRGTGTLTLTGASDYAGLTTVSEGTLRVGSATALGSTAAGTTVEGGAAVEIDGTFNLSESFTIAGNGVANGGALRFVSGDATLSGPITLSANARINSDSTGTPTIISTIGGADRNLTLGGSGNLTISGAINLGAGALIKDGAGTVRLTGANTYTDTTINGGTLAVAGASSIGSGIITMNGGALQADSTFTLANELTFATGSDARLVTAPNVTLTGTGKINLLGTMRVGTTGTDASAGTYQFSHGTASVVGTARLIIESGTLLNTTSVVFPGVLDIIALTQIDSPGTLNIGGRAASIRNLQGSGTLLNDGVTTTIRGGSFAGNLGGTQSIISTGALTLSGASNYTGTTTVSSGTLTISNALALGTASGGTTVAAGATLAFAGDFDLQNEAIVLNGFGEGNSGALRGVSGTNGISIALLSLQSDSRINSDADLLSLNRIEGNGNALTLGGSGTLIINDDITNISSLTKDGTGFVTLFGNNTITGPTTINGGNIDLLGDESLSDTALLTVADRASVRFGFSETIGALAGAGTVGILSGVVLTTGGNDTSTTFSGRLQSLGSLVKNGTGTFTLTGSNSYFGSTTINAGTLQIGNGGIGGTVGLGAITIGAGATLAFNRSTNLGISNVISGTGTLLHSGTGVTTLLGNSDFTGTTTVTAGQLRFNGTFGGTITVNGGRLGGTGTLSGPVTINSGGTLAAGLSPGTLTVGSLTLNAGSITEFELGEAGVAGGANNDLIRVTGNLALNGGTINIVRGTGFGVGAYTLFEFGTLSGALGNLSLNPLDGNFVGTLALDGNTVLLNAAPAEDLIFWNGSTTSPTGVLVGGSGTWNLTNTNFTENDGVFSGAWEGNGFQAVFSGTAGTVTIGAGLQLAPSGLAFLTDGYVITGADAGSGLVFNGPTGIDTATGVGATIAAPISGTGSVTKTGDGTLTLSGTNTYGGATSILGGTLVNTGTITGSVTNMATLTSTGTLLSGLTNMAGATANLAGNVADVTNFGTANITGDLTGSGNFANAAAGLVTVATATTSTISGVISNNGTAADAFTINGALSTTSQFDNNAGAQLLIGATGSLATANGLNNAGTVVNNGTIDSIVRNGGTFTSTGTISQELINQVGAAATLSGNVAQVSNSGTLTLVGTTTGSARLDNTPSGLVTVNAGASASFAGDIFNGGTAADAFTVNGSFSSGGRFFNQFGANLLIGSTGTLSAADGIVNGGGATLVNNGTIASNVFTAGTFTSTGTLQSGLELIAISASANLSGTVTGTITNPGTINLIGALLGEAALVQGGFGVLNLNGFDTSFGSLSGSGSINMDTATLTVGGNDTSTTFSGVIGGSGGLVKTGAGIFTLSGVNTYSGETRIDEGTLALASSGVIAGRVRNGATFTNAGTVNGSVINLGSFTSTGTVQGGLTQFAGSSATLSGTLNGEIRNGGALTVNGDLASNNFAQTSGDSTTEILSGARWSGLLGFSNLSTNANGVVISGTLDVSGIVGNFAGATMTIDNGGTLTAQNMANLGRTNNNGTVNTDITNSGAIDNNGTWNGGLSQGTGSVTNNAQWNGFFLVDAGGLVTNIGTWANNSGFLSAVREGTFENFGTLTGGGVSVSGAGALFANRAGGTITLGTGQFLTVSSDGVISNAGTITAGAQVLGGGVIQNDASGSWTGSFSVATNASLTNAGTLSGNILNRGTLSSAGTINGLLVNEEGANASLAGVFNGDIANSGLISLVGSTFGIGTLEQSSTGAFDMSGIDTRIGALEGNGLVLLRGGDLTLAAATGTNTYVGEITGTGGLIKTGAATQIFTGDLAYTGEAEILGGTLVIAGGSLAGSVRNTADFILDGRLFGELNNVGSMQIAGQVDGFTLNNGTITNIGNSIFLGRFEQSASMGTSLNLAGFNTRLGSLNGAGAVNLGTGVLTVGSDNTSARFTGVIGGEGALVKIGTGDFALTGVNTFTGPTVINGGVVDLASDGALAGAVENNATFVNRGRVAGLVVNNASLISTGRLNGGLFNAVGAAANLSGQVNGAVDNAGLITLTGETTGFGVLTQAATGVFDMADFDTTVGGLAGLGSITLGSGTLTVSNGNFAVIYGGVISGSGGLIKNGGLTLRLGGQNTFTGLATISQGAIVLEDQASLAGSVLNNGFFLNGGTVGGSVTNNGSLLTVGRIIGNLSNNGSAEMAGRIDGTVLNNGAMANVSGLTVLGRFTQTASGSYNLAGFNSSVGSLDGAGTIQLGSGFLNLGGDNTSSTFAGVIAGAGGVVKNGTGTFTLSGINTYTGTTFVNAGTLVVGDTGVIAPPPPPPPPPVETTLAAAGSQAESGRTMLARGEAGLAGGRTAASLANGTGAAPVSLAAVTAEAAGEAPSAAPLAAMTSTLSSAVIAGSVVNSATLINNGTILGQVVNNSGASTANHGVIEGAVLNDGTLVSTGTLGGGLANNGSATIEGVLDGDVINTGTITLTGITSGIDIFEQTGTGIFNLAGFDTTIGAISGAGSILLGDARLTTGTDGIATLFSGVISGSGSLDKVGTGRLVLTGTNTYSGGTTISGGVLQLGDGGAGGSIIGPVVNNGALVVNRSDAYTFAGNISGTGMFVQDGTGTTTLTGANTYTGGTLISRGRLVGNTTSLRGQIQNDAALEFAQGTAGTFAGQLFGAGLFDKTGAGMLTLTGNSNGFTGGTFVRAGELRVTGSLAGSRVTVLSGATLSGTGVIGGLVANSGSTIAPGAGGAGMLGVNGAVTLQAGSTVQLQIRADGNGDVIVATGAAQLGGTAAFTNLGGTYAFNSEYVLLQADGGRTGTFNAATGFAGFGILYRPEIVYTAQQARLRFAPNLLANIVGNTALTTNQRSVVNRIDGAVTAGYNPQPLFNVYALPTAQLPGAFDQLSGEVYATAAGVGIEQERLVREAVLGRLGAVAMAARQTPEAGTGAGAWGQLFGGWGDGEGDGNVSAFESDRAGFVTGLDYGSANENGSWRVGVFGMHITSDVTIDRLGSSAQVEQSGGGAYASLSSGGFGAALGGYLTTVDLTGSRNIALPGFNDTLAGATNGDGRQAFAELSYTIPAGKGMIRPFVAGAIGSFKLDAMTERGGAAALDVARQSYSTGSVTAGLDGMVPVGKGFTLSGTLAGRAQLGDRDPQAQIALAAAPQQSFAISGVQLDEVAVAARLEAMVDLGDNVDFMIGYTGLIGSTISDHGARATLQVRF